MPLQRVATLQHSLRSCAKQGQHPQRQPAPPPPPPLHHRRRLLSLAPLLFLPWRGCDQGGSYSTGVQGTPGKDCQQIYQPAGAAEKRFAERGRQPPPPQQQQQQQASMPPTAEPLQPAAATEREELATLRKEQAAYDRGAMQAGQEERTRQLVDSMWQSLE